MRPFIKICGITRQEDLAVCVENKIDALGFVLVPDSPRCIDLSQLENLCETVPKGILKIGVVAGQDRSFLKEAADAGKLSAIQLHGGESAEFARSVDFCAVWKAVSLVSENDVGEYWNYPAEMLIADSVKGSGVLRCDWPLAGKLAPLRKILLAGGLTPENAVRALTETHVFGIDLSSGVELEPGIKSKKRIVRLVQNIREHFQYESKSGL